MSWQSWIGGACLATATIMGSTGAEMDRYELARDIPYYEADMPQSGNLEYLAERCRLDIYHPKDQDNLCTVVFFHGGGLSSGEKGVPELLKECGLIVVAPNYRLSSDRAACPDYLNDAAAAVAWTFRHIAEYGGDPKLVFVSGGSAGGYLSAMIGLDPRWLAQFGHANTELAGVMPISGQMSTHFQILNERNGTSGMTPPEHMVVDEYAPLYHAAGSLPPVRLYVGDAELDWPARTQENALLAATLRRVAQQRNVRFHELTGFNHGDVYDPACLLMRKEIRELKSDALRQNFKMEPVSLGNEAIIVPFTGRAGCRETAGTTASLKIEGDDLVVHVDCPEPRMDALVAGDSIWNSDCVELYLESAPDVIGQWIVSADGRFQYFSYGMPDPGATGGAERQSDGWTAEFRVPLDAMKIEKLRGNLLRRRMAGGDDTFTNWSPIFGDANLEPAAFVTMRLP